MPEPTTWIAAVPVNRDDFHTGLRERLRETIEAVLEEELEAALGAEAYARCAARRGYRNGSQVRPVVTEHGPTELRIPRARVFREGGSEEWHSAMVPRYQRRTRQVDEAILSTYLAGANSRRIRKALQPLLGTQALSRHAVCRIVARLKKSFEIWRQRDLSHESYGVLYLDAMRLPVRMARRVVKVPVQAVLGVRQDGQKVLLSLEIAASESTASWRMVVQSLKDRGLVEPVTVVLDGNAGLCRAVRDTWPGALQQRCTKHKLENLLAKAPKHCHSELTRDYRAITHAESAPQAQQAYGAFVRKWRTLLPEVVRSLEEAGSDLLTYIRFPYSMWKSLRTTNQIERLNEEFRRRTKTQGSFTNEASALVLLYGLFAMGMIQLRRIDGWEEMPLALEALKSAA